MTARLAVLAALCALAVPARSEPALGQAGRADRPGAFDGARERGGDAVLAGPRTDNRRPEQIAAEEQAKADALAKAPKATAPLGVDKEAEAPKPNPWLAPAHLYNGAKGALLGALIGTLGGWVGALVGAAVGFAIAYAISRITS